MTRYRITREITRLSVVREAMTVEASTAKGAINQCRREPKWVEVRAPRNSQEGQYSIAELGETGVDFGEDTVGFDVRTGAPFQTPEE
jgi:uncharacterized membrane protein